MRISRLAPFTAMALAACATDRTTESDDTTETAQAASAGSPTSRWPVVPIHYWIDANLTSGPHANPTQLHCGDAVGAAVVDTNPASNAVTVQAINDAIAAYQEQTPVRFIPLTSLPSSNPGYPVLIYTRGATDSNPHAGGVPKLNAMNTTDPGDWQGCVYLPPGDKAMHTIEHETGHQLGLIHEQRRSDYCSTVAIDQTCISDSATDDGNHPFKTVTGSQNLAPYDTDSIMEYGNNAFCDITKPDCDDGTGHCKHPTIMKLGCSTTTGACAVGGADDFSRDDINALYRMYEPSLGSDETNDQFGAAMAAGDFDGDGYDDLAVGAPGEAPFSDPTTGAVFLYKGTEGGLVAWKVLRESDFASLGAAVHAGDKFGASIAAGHYYNHSNTQIDDLIVGAPGYQVGGVAGAGAAFVYRGWGTVGHRLLTADAFFPDPAPTAGPDSFGAAVAMGNLDGSHGAIAVGAPNGAKFTVRNGEVWTRNATASSWTLFSPDSGAPLTYAQGTNFGAAVAIGNLTSGTSGGLAVGAPGFSGKVWVYSGAGSFLGIAMAASPASGDKFGAAIAIGHFYSATKEHLVVGAPGASGAGSVTTFDTTTSGVARLTTITEANVPGMAAEAGDKFGAALARGDLDDDGFDDLVIGVPGENSAQGVIALVQGGTMLGWTWRGEKSDGWTRQAGDKFGSAVAVGRFGDLYDDVSDRNDAAADIAAGAPARQPGGVTGAGTFQEFFGQSGGDPVFALGFDEHRVNGIQPPQPGGPAPLTCPLVP